MTDPVEIMAWADFTHDWPDEDWAEIGDHNRSLFLTEARAKIAALEAAGWRIVHPDKVAEEMRIAFRDCSPELFLEGECIKAASQRIQREKVAAAIAAAPLYGKG